MVGGFLLFFKSQPPIRSFFSSKVSPIWTGVLISPVLKSADLGGNRCFRVKHVENFSPFARESGDQISDFSLN